MKISRHLSHKVSENKGFTLIEMILSITVFAVIIILAFDSLGKIGIMRTRVSNNLDLNGELYFAVERLADLIKDGGSTDYEEYWDRSAVGTATLSGHYSQFTGFGNYGFGASFVGNVYGSGLYYCRSKNGSSMGTGGCLADFNSFADMTSPNTNYTGSPQRYGEYGQQFIDYNANLNNDGGDEDGNGDIRGDDDDEDLGIGPDAFVKNTPLRELYLFKKWNRVERTFFRWNLRYDPNSPTYNPSTGIDPNCSLSGATMGSGCLGNIQMLKLVGRDLGISHSSSSVSPGQYDGVIDTWECQSDFNCLGTNNLPSGADSEWVDLFPDYINVKDVRFYPFPSKDFGNAWKEGNPDNSVNAYVRFSITLWLSWGRKKQIHGDSDEVSISTTINLTK